MPPLSINPSSKATGLAQSQQMSLSPMHATTPHSYISPINTVPNELLSHIFVLGVQMGSDGKYRLQTLPLEVLVSHVCVRWREVALADQALWTRINCSRYALDQVAAYLERSRDAPLEITIRNHRDKFWVTFDLALNHVRRWRSLSAVGIFKPWMKKILDRLVAVESAPMLEHIALECHIKSTPLIHDTPFRGNIPNLKTFSLTKIDLKWDDYDMWSNLESLALYYQREGNRPSFPTFVRMLTSSEKLTELVLEDSGPVDYPDTEPGKYPAPEPYPTHTITSLKVLELHGNATEDTIPFLTHFHCPNITKLHLSDWGSEQWGAVFEFLAIPHPSAYSTSILSRLTELSLYGAPVSGKLLMKAVEGLDELRTLILGGSVSEEWLSLLEQPRWLRTQDIRETTSSSTIPESSRMYMPKLTSVTFGYGVCCLHTARCIAECREKAGLPLRTLRFLHRPKRGENEDSEASDAKDEQWLRENVENFVQ